MNISRFYNMEKLDLTIEFLTPTFLGGADQQGELRSPPFKNLLRQWWRIVNGNLPLDQLRFREGELFGAVQEDKVHKILPHSSQVRMSIKDSNVSNYSGSSLQYPKVGINHPEVGGKFMPIEVYLGMGPVFYNKDTKNSEYKRSAIKPGSTCGIEITFPKNNTSILEALYLIGLFGSIGSRCRNGWGSLGITTNHPLLTPRNITDLKTAMNDGKQYPHTLCTNEKGFLAWETQPQNDFVTAWQQLAQAYLSARTTDIMKNFGTAVVADDKHTQFVAHKSASARHLLGYPTTHHKINDETWGENKKNFNKPKKIEGRLASPLRMAIKKEGTRFIGRILHLPYSVHMNFPGNQEGVWQNVHSTLDSLNSTLHRMEMNEYVK